MEIWKDIKGYEDYYRISNLGRVARKTKRGDKLLNPLLNKKGYLFVRLSMEDVKKEYLLHRLVANAFIDNPNNYRFVRHKDGNITNNTVDNLEWRGGSNR